ncbi:hypothetical protein [Fischerella muscicola]|uniref:Uncharacterized protein n=2 Tax=Fischerella TaxID=1190 RepID=A0A2N6JXL1_FISMU|nr:hypothetical protein [Fischerella muscicola]PLZ85251.1 hypothetical protein CEN44_22695 [Fischerella muscicola CCMEE 5323]
MVVIEEKRQRSHCTLGGSRGLDLSLYPANIARSVVARGVAEGRRKQLQGQIEKRRGGYARVKPLFFMALSKPFRQLSKSVGSPFALCHWLLVFLHVPLR